MECYGTKPVWAGVLSDVNSQTSNRVFWKLLRDELGEVLALSMWCSTCNLFHVHRPHIRVSLPIIGIVMNCIPYPTAFPYGNGMVLHFYQQQESSTTKTVHKVINKGLKAYV